MDLLLTAIGILLLAASLAGVAFGLYMMTHPRSREQGELFAIWWVPAAAAAAGVLMRDPVTFLVGLACFAVAGAVLLLRRRPSATKERAHPDTGWHEDTDTPATARAESERTTLEMKSGRWRKQAGTSTEARPPKAKPQSARRAAREARRQSREAS